MCLTGGEETPAEDRYDALRLVDDLPPGETDHVPVAEGEREISIAVAVESDLMRMRPAPVGLDNDPVVGPVEVDLQLTDITVDDGTGEARGFDQLQEASLELSPGRGCLVAQVGKEIA
jgi:hypothetical protein